MLKSVTFKNFRTLNDFKITLTKRNVLVGPNNSGKSTILLAIKALSGALRYARTRKPSYLTINKNELKQGFEIPDSSLGFDSRNIQSNYNEKNSTIYFKLSDRKQALKLLFSRDKSTKLLLENYPKRINTTNEFKKVYPIDILSVPTLGPLEKEEKLLQEKTVLSNINSRLAHRRFRNIWHYSDHEKFEQFQKYVEDTWPNMAIKNVELEPFNSLLSMFCEERRMTRELYWAGFGFQIWLQILTHMTLSSGQTIVIDEPDIYLHPELQRRLIALLTSKFQQWIIATHSTEILNSVDQSDVVEISPDYKKARRISDLEGLQAILESLGSTQNIELSRLSLNQKILFFEGKDFRIIRKFAQKLGLHNTQAGSNFNIIPIGHFPKPEQLKNASWILKNALNANSVKFALIVDRDYRSEKQIQTLSNEFEKHTDIFYFTEGKEIENYLIVPTSIARAFKNKINKKSNTMLFTSEQAIKEINLFLEEIFLELKDSVRSQIISKKLEDSSNRGIDKSTIIEKETKKFKQKWADENIRKLIVPGKTVISKINNKLQDKYHISITHNEIITSMKVNEISPHLNSLLKTIEKFSNS